jgi:hypothetical protein
LQDPSPARHREDILACLDDAASLAEEQIAPLDLAGHQALG